MIDKAKIAEKAALIILEAGLRGEWDMSDISECATDAWLLADAMQAESDKRKAVGVPDAIRERHDFTPEINKGFERASQEEWQPDWSQAPEWADAWRQAPLGHGLWTKGVFFAYRPCGDVWVWAAKTMTHIYDELGMSVTAPTFDYKGGWRDSLRERPL